MVFPEDTVDKLVGRQDIASINVVPLEELLDSFPDDIHSFERSSELVKCKGVTVVSDTLRILVEVRQQALFLRVQVAVVGEVVSLLNKTPFI